MQGPYDDQIVPGNVRQLLDTPAFQLTPGILAAMREASWFNTKPNSPGATQSLASAFVPVNDRQLSN